MKTFFTVMLQILGYFVLFTLIALPFLALWYPYVERHLPDLADTPATQWPVEAVSILAALLAAWLMSFASKSIQDYNFGLRRRTFAQHTLAGLFIGLGMIIFTLTSLNLMGVLSGNPQYRFVWNGMLAALITTVSLNAIAQEIIFRGYFINVLKRKFSTKTTIIVSSLIVTAFHADVFMQALPTSIIMGLSLFLGGILMALAYLRTNSLWLPIGLHIGWNLAQALLNLAVTGQKFSDGEAPIVLTGPVIITGGTAGLEGSVIGLCSVIVGTVIVLILYRQTKPANKIEYGSYKTRLGKS